MRFFWPFFHRKERSLSPKQPPWERTPPPVSPVAFDEQGRRHRTDVPYLLPKDERELQRLNYQHYLFRQILQGSNTLAPADVLLKKGGNVLDVGCGTGQWGSEIASLYQKTQVIGLDLEDIPRTASMPLNYHFQQGDVLRGLPFAAQQFEYVHQRLLVAGIPLERWPFVVGELRRVTAPAGWVELVEMGTTFHDAGPATKQFLAWWAAISATRGIDASKVEGIGTLLEATGFSMVRTHTAVIPVGSWGGRLGDLLSKDILAGWPNVKSYAHTLLGISNADFDVVINRLEDEWNTYQTRYAIYFACGCVSPNSEGERGKESAHKKKEDKGEDGNARPIHTVADWSVRSPGAGEYSLWQHRLFAQYRPFIGANGHKNSGVRGDKNTNSASPPWW